MLNPKTQVPRMPAAIASALFVLASAAPVEAPKPLDVVVRRHGDAFVAERPHAAVVFAVTTPAGRRTWGFGAIERDGRRTTPDSKTLYEIGSITKTLTSTILADLVVKGTIKLDDPVRTQLPCDWEFPTRDGRDVSFLHLATHTSSLPRMPPGFGPFLVLTGSGDDPYSQYRDENLRLTLAGLELQRPIGSRYEYSNLGAGLLGFALAKAAEEESVDALFAHRVLEPLRLADTTFDLTDEQHSRLAPPFKANGDASHEWRFDCLKACGGLRSNADDMLAYAEAAMGRTDTPLRPAFDLAIQRWREIGSGEQAIGLGWFVQPMPAPGRGPTRLVWHNGATGGYRAFLGMLPEYGSAVVVLSNTTAAVDPNLSQPVLRALLREQARP
jgi:CubicO group peptidase (beta-lactamase class C family)